MIISQIIFSIIISFFWLMGGSKSTWPRDFLIPIIVGVFAFLNHPTDILWQNIVISVLTIATCNLIRLGYGSLDPNDSKPSLLAKITKDKNGWWIRGIYGLICGTFACVPLLIFKYDGWTVTKCSLYVLQFAVVCFTVVRMRSRVHTTDLCIGLSFSARILF